MTYIGTECEHPHMPSRRSRRTRARALVAAAAVPGGFGDGGVLVRPQSGAVKNTTLTVAAFNPFTGPDASFGPEMMAGCLTAVTAVNAAGGVLGNKVACSSVDTRGDPADAVTGAAKMLATTPHLFGVLGPSSDEADSTAPLINAAKITMFADTGEASFDHTKLQYFWRMTPADDVQGDAMALYAKQKGYLRAAAVFGNDIGSQGSRADAAEGLQRTGRADGPQPEDHPGPDLLSAGGRAAHRGQAAGHLHRSLAAGQRDVPGRAAAAGPHDPGHRQRRDGRAAAG